MLLSVHVTSVLNLVWFWPDYVLLLELHALTLVARSYDNALGIDYTVHWQYTTIINNSYSHETSVT